MIACDIPSDKTLYLDSNILIYAVETAYPEAPSSVALVGLFQSVQSKLARVLTSQLTLSEVLVLPLREGNQGLEQTYRRLLRGSPNFGVSPVTLPILERSADLRARYKGIKLADAIHLATAIECSCHSFLTADKQFRQCEKEIPILLLDQ